jgi:hypothetical protein
MTDETKDQERFLKYVQKDESTGCWRWTGSKACTGYANFYYKGAVYLAHRASLLIFGRVKELTPGLNVAHSCRNRDCVAPDHLSEKTKSENNGTDKKSVPLGKSTAKFISFDYITQNNSWHLVPANSAKVTTGYRYDTRLISNYLTVQGPPPKIVA